MTFLIWGTLHGLALVTERAGSMMRIELPDWMKLTGTFLFVSMAWVIFRSPDLNTAMRIYQSMVGANGFVMPSLFAEISGFEGEILSGLTGFEVLAIAGLIWWVWTQPNIHEIDFQPNWTRWSAAVTACGIIMLSITSPAKFLYFQF